MPLNLGDRFTSFVGFQGALEIFKSETNSDFYIADSRTLPKDGKMTNFRERARNAPEILKYYHVKYRCVHGGTFRKKKSSRYLRNTSTVRIGCEVFISLLLSDDGQALVIKSMYLEHNHEVSPELHTFIPKRKRGRQQMRIKVKDLQDPKQKSLNREKYLIQERVSKKKSESFNALDEDVTLSGTSEPEMFDFDEKISHALPEGTNADNEELCKCGFGTWELSKQDLMLMEVEEHHRRLEILQLQEAYQVERIEKMRYLQELKLKKAEQEVISLKNF